MKQRIAFVLVLGMLPWAGILAQPKTATTTFRVTAKVQAVCEMSVTDLAFGNYKSTTDAPLQGETLLQATCTPGSAYSIGLNAGAGPGATTNVRKMVSGATNTLDYQLYSDSTRSKIWGNTGNETVAGVGTGVANEHPVFGSVPAAQTSPAGSYTDTIVVTITY